MLENNVIEMATQLKGSVRKARKLRLVLVYMFICINQSLGSDSNSIYETADHYWPLKNISDNTSLDTISNMHAQIMNGAKLNNTKLFGPAAILDGEDDWINLALMSDDCTNMPSECHDGFTISFWLYYIRGEFLLCAGAYTSKDKGPGIKFTFGDNQNVFMIEVSTLKYTWKFTSKLVVRTWVHVAFKWSASQGIHLYLNGNAVQQKGFPKKEVTFERPHRVRGWSLGRPNDIFKLTKFGNFGIAHLAQWLRELTAVEIKAAFLQTILHDQQKLIEELRTTKPPTSQPTRKSPSKRQISNAVNKFLHANLWFVVSALLLLFLLFQYPF